MISGFAMEAGGRTAAFVFGGGFLLWGCFFAYIVVSRRRGRPTSEVESTPSDLRGLHRKGAALYLIAFPLVSISSIYAWGATTGVLLTSAGLGLFTISSVIRLQRGYPT